MKNYLIEVYYDNGYTQVTVTGSDLNKAYYDFSKTEAKHFRYPIGFKLIN